MHPTCRPAGQQWRDAGGLSVAAAQGLAPWGVVRKQQRSKGMPELPADRACIKSPQLPMGQGNYLDAAGMGRPALACMLSLSSRM
jgi:hypothetical protein